MKIIHVTQKDINDGLESDGYKCPVAHAMNRELNVENAWVSDSSIETNIESGVIPYIVYYHVPRSVKRFVNRFDGGKKVKPFNFILKVENEENC